MPSSGYGITNLFEGCESTTEMNAKMLRLNARALHAMKSEMFIEWLESFVSAWEQTKDVDIASWAGLEEWDL